MRSVLNFCSVFFPISRPHYRDDFLSMAVSVDDNVSVGERRMRGVVEQGEIDWQMPDIYYTFITLLIAMKMSLLLLIHLSWLLKKKRRDATTLWNGEDWFYYDGEGCYYETLAAWLDRGDFFRNFSWDSRFNCRCNTITSVGFLFTCLNESPTSSRRLNATVRRLVYLWADNKSLGYLHVLIVERK